MLCVHIGDTHVFLLLMHSGGVDLIAAVSVAVIGTQQEERPVVAAVAVIVTVRRNPDGVLGRKVTCGKYLF